MKKLFTLLMLLCTISAFAANVAGTYNGTLKITVDGTAPTTKDQSVTVTDNGSVVTLTIPKFSYPGYPIAADVVITATKDDSGNLFLTTIKYGFMPLTGVFNPGSKIEGNSCNILLSITAMGQNIDVTFTGTK